MSAGLIYWSAMAAQFMLATAMLLACIRLIKGPRAQDRVLAVDMLFNVTMLMVLVLGVRTGNPHYFPMALVIAVAGFVSSVALAKFLMRGEVIE